MAKFLRVLIIILLLLSVGALVLGIMLFNKREQLKGHVQQYVTDVLRLAEFVEAEQAEELTQKDLPKMNTVLSKDYLLTYVTVDEGTGLKRADGPGTMREEMNKLIARANNQLRRLDDTRDELKLKREELAEALKKIEGLETKVASLEQTIAGLEARIAELNQQIRQKDEQIAALQEKNADLEADIRDKEDEIAKLRDDKLDLEDKIKQLEELIRRLRPDRPPEEGGAPAATAPGLKGKVVLVNPEWNFIVIAAAEGANLIPALQLIVQRDDQLVGKVRVADVNEEYRLVIADILGDWQQVPLEVGDHVFY